MAPLANGSHASFNWNLSLRKLERWRHPLSSVPVYNLLYQSLSRFQMWTFHFALNASFSIGFGNGLIVYPEIYWVYTSIYDFLDFHTEFYGSIVELTESSSCSDSGSEALTMEIANFVRNHLKKWLLSLPRGVNQSLELSKSSNTRFTEFTGVRRAAFLRTFRDGIGEF